MELPAVLVRWNTTSCALTGRGEGARVVRFRGAGAAVGAGGVGSVGKGRTRGTGEQGNDSARRDVCVRARMYF